MFQRFADPVHLRQTLVALGGWGYLAFIVSYSTLQPFGVPGTIFIIAASLIWPWPIAFTLSMIGTMAASIVGFSFARFVARDWVSTKIPPKMQQYSDLLVRRAFVTVLVLRLVFWMPPWLHAFFGVSNVRFSTHFWGSLLGYILPLLLTSYCGPKLFDMVRQAPPLVWFAVLLVIASIATLVWLSNRGKIASKNS